MNLYETTDGQTITHMKPELARVLVRTDEGAVLELLWTDNVIGGVCKVQLVDIPELQTLGRLDWVEVKRNA